MTYARYDYAWKTPGWNAQDPYIPEPSVDGYLDPGLPTDITYIRVWDDFLEWDSGRGLEGVVTFRVKEVLEHTPTGRTVMPGRRRLRFRKDGFSINLPATDDPQLTPEFQYECRLTVRGVTREFAFSLPAATPDGEVRLSTLIPEGILGG